MKIFAFITSLLILWRAVYPLPVKWYWKVVIGMFFVVSAFKFHIFHLFGGPMYFAPELPRGLLLAGAWCFGVVFVFFFLLALAELVRLPIYLVRRKKLPANWCRNNNIINGALLGVSLLLTTAGIICGTALPEVKEITLEIDGLPVEAEKLKFVLLSDLHADKLTRRDTIRQIVERVNKLKPDYIFITGDFVDGRVSSCGVELLPLKELFAEYGVYAVAGNHEYYSGFNEWCRFLEEKCNIRMLINDSLPIAGNLQLAGVADDAGKLRKLPAADLDRALQNSEAGRPVILLAHRPAFAHIAAQKKDVILQLSGHTHGGMIYGIDAFVALANGGFATGVHKVGKTVLYVSNGSGIWNGFPVRLGRNSEITLLRLKRSGK